MKNNENKIDIPKNINEFRQIVKKNSNIGNLNWVYKLRNFKKIEKISLNYNSIPFNCYNKIIVSFENKIKKSNFIKPKINNKTFHLIKRRPGGETSHNQINFETNLRIFKSLNNEKLNTNNLYYNYKLKDSKNGILIELKKELKIKKEIKKQLKVIENMKDIKEKLKIIKNLPNLKQNIYLNKSNINENFFKKNLNSIKYKTDNQLNFKRNLRNSNKIKYNFNISKKLYNNYIIKNLWKGIPIKFKDELRIKKEIKNKLIEIEKIKDFKERLKKIKNLPITKNLI